MRPITTLWSYRGFVWGSVRREFQARYRNSLLGAAWNVLNPLAMIFIYTVVFASVMRAKLPGINSTFAYSIYLCAGTLAWGFFTEVASRNLTIFLDNASLLKKINFPRIVLPTIVVLNATVNFSIVALLFVCFLLISGNFPGWVILGAIPVLTLQTLFAIGLGLSLGVLNVFFRDVGQLFGLFLQFWFWLTPIVYPANILPEVAKPFVALNPMAPVVTAYQDIFVNRLWPDWGGLSLTALLTAAFCLLALYLFNKNAGDLVDEL